MSGPADTRHRPFGLPEPFGLYDPARDHNSCGVGLYANIRNDKSHQILQQGLRSCEISSIAAPWAPIPRRATAAGVLFQIPHDFFAAEASGSASRCPRRSDYAVGLPVHAARAGPARGNRAHLVGDRARGGPQGSGLARRAGR